MTDDALGLELLHIVAVGSFQAALELVEVVDVMHHAQLNVVGVEAREQVVKGNLALFHVARAHVLAVLPGGANVTLHNPMPRVLGTSVSQTRANLGVAHPAVHDVDAQLGGTQRDGARLIGAHAVEPLPAKADLGHLQIRTAKPSIVHACSSP